MTYDYKRMQEFLWFVAVAVGTVLCQMLVEFDPTTITDWRAWAISLGAAAVRAAVGAVIAYQSKNALDDPDNDAA